jgi:hypothetical protein
MNGTRCVQQVAPLYISLKRSFGSIPQCGQDTKAFPMRSVWGCSGDSLARPSACQLNRGGIASSIRKMMLPLMAGNTKCDQVVQSIFAELAPLRQMMYVQVFRRTAILTAPAISFEHSLAE